METLHASPPASSEETERLLRAVVEATRQLVEHRRLDEGLRAALRALGEMSGRGRAYIFRDVESPPALRLFEEWNAPGLPTIVDTVGPGPYLDSDYPEITPALRRGESIGFLHSERVGANRLHNEVTQSLSDIFVPIFVEERFWGLVGLDDMYVDRHYSAAEIEVLRGAAAAIAAAIIRDRSEQRLRAHEAGVAAINQAVQRSAQALAETADVQGFFSTLLAETMQLSGAVSAAVFAYEEATETLRMKALRADGRLIDIAGDDSVAFWREPVPREISRNWVALLRQHPWVSFDNELPPDRHPWPISAHWHRSLGHRAVVDIPLYIGERLIGIFGQCFRQPLEDSFFDYERTRVFAHQTALALQLSTLNEQAQAAVRARERDAAARDSEAKRARERERELARRNELLGLLAEVSRLLLGESFPGTVCARMLEQLGIALDADRAAIARFEDDPQGGLPWCVLIEEWTASDTPRQMDDANLRRTRLAGNVTDWQRFKAGLPIQLHVSAVPAEAQGDQLRANARSLLGLPVRVAGALWGVLGFDSCTDLRVWDEIEIGLLQSVATAIGAAIEREQAVRVREAAVAEERERAAEQRIQELIDSNQALRKATTALTQLDNLEDFLAEFLREALRLTGAWCGAVALIEGDELSHPVLIDREGEHSEMHRRSTGWGRVAITPELRAYVECIAASPESCESCPDEAIRIKGFATFHTQIKLGSVRNVPMRVGERLVGWLGLGFQGRPELASTLPMLRVLADHMTMAVEMVRLADAARHSAVLREREQAARQRAAELAGTTRALQRTLDVLASESRWERTLGHVLTVLSEQLATQSAAVWMEQPPESGRYRVHLIYHHGEIVDAGSDHPGAAHWPVTRDLQWKEHIHTRRAVIYDVDHLPNISPEMVAFFRRVDARGLLGVPLLLGERVIGSFTVRFREARDFTAEQLELAQALAHQATLALRLSQFAEHAASEARQAAVLAERNRIGGEIHDGLAQNFTGMLMQVDALEAANGSIRHEELAERLNNLRELARDGLAEARRSVMALKPAAAQRNGLSMALQQLCERSSVPGRLTCTSELSALDETLPPEVRHALFRIAQEAMSNAVRHGQPSQVHIRASRDALLQSLHIEDNGRGMANQPDVDSQGGFGLASMRERAEALGGQLEVVSSPGQGTCISVHLPASVSGLAPSRVTTT